MKFGASALRARLRAGKYRSRARVQAAPVAAAETDAGNESGYLLPWRSSRGALEDDAEKPGVHRGFFGRSPILGLGPACLAAFLITLCTLMLRLSLGERLGDRPASVIFAIPIALSTYLGGLWAGLVATALTGLAAAYFLFPPLRESGVNSSSDRWELFIVLLTGVVLSAIISAVNKALHGARRNTLAADRRQQRAQRATVQSEQRLQAIVENMSEALIVSDLQGKILYWNKAGLEMHDFRDLEEGLQRIAEFSEIFQLSTLDGIPIAPDRWPLSCVLRHEPVHRMTVRVHRTDVVWQRVFSYSGEIVEYDGGARQMAFLSINDLTEYQSARESLQAQVARFQLLDQITRGIGERHDLLSVYQVAVGALEDNLPADFSCVLANEPGADALTVVGIGARGDGLVLKRGDSVPIGHNGLTRCLNGQLVYEPDTAVVAHAFAAQLARCGLRSVVISPMQTASRVVGVLLAARKAPGAFDSSECEFIRQLGAHVALAANQAQLHGELQAAFAELRHSQQGMLEQERLRALGQMASGIAHDINNAITPAILYAEILLEKEPLSERARTYIESIARAVDDVASTVARMREFYRRREPQLRLSALPLNELIGQVIELSSARWKDMPLQRGIVITVATELTEPLPVVLGVESEVREALINLVFNAVDAMPDGGVMTLATRVVPAEAPGTGKPGATAAGAPSPHKLRVALEVSDTGVGMSEATRQRCVEPFFTTKGDRGTGLGLAMVFGIARRHDAQVVIESEPGAGSRVRLLFPVSDERAVDRLLPAGPFPGRLRILLIDDDPSLLYALRSSLEGDGHIAETASGGQAGIDAFRAGRHRAEPHDVVITDLGMPHVDGRTVAAAIKRQSPLTPVILLTGWGQRMMEDGESPADVDMVLGKPPKLKDLRAALARCCSPALQLNQ